MTHPGERLAPEEFERRLVLRSVAEDLDFLEIIHDHGLESVMPADRIGRAPRALKRARVDRVDLEGRKRRAHEPCLPLPEIAERRVSKLPERAAEVEHLVRMADEQDLGD